MTNLDNYEEINKAMKESPQKYVHILNSIPKSYCRKNFKDRLVEIQFQESSLKGSYAQKRNQLKDQMKNYPISKIEQEKNDNVPAIFKCSLSVDKQNLKENEMKLREKYLERKKKTIEQYKIHQERDNIKIIMPYQIGKTDFRNLEEEKDFQKYVIEKQEEINEQEKEQYEKFIKDVQPKQYVEKYEKDVNVFHRKNNAYQGVYKANDITKYGASVQNKQTLALQVKAEQQINQIKDKNQNNYVSNLLSKIHENSNIGVQLLYGSGDSFQKDKNNFNQNEKKTIIYQNSNIDFEDDQNEERGDNSPQMFNTIQQQKDIALKSIMNKLTRFAFRCGNKMNTFAKQQKQVSFNTMQALSQIPKFQFSDNNNKYSEETMNKLKKDAEAFYQAEIKDKSNIVEITSVEQWKTEVIESKIPVILDCYADWCEPCRKLDPILKAKAEQLGDKAKLVKLNIDNNPQVASALQVKSIPTVYLINGANAIDGFVGYPDEKNLEKFFETANRICGLADEESDIQAQIALAQTFLEQNKNIKENTATLMTILGSEKWKNRFGGKVHALLALAEVLQGNQNQYKKQLHEIKTKFSEEAESEEIKDILSLCETKQAEIQEANSSHPFIIECNNILKNNELDHETRYKLAEYQSNNSMNEEAVDNCLFIVKKNRNWEDKKAQQLLISVFNQLGSQSDITIKGRQKLQRLLF